MVDFRKKVELAYTIAVQELENRKRGIDGESTEAELEQVIIPEMQELMVIVDRKQLPPKEKRYLKSFANAFRVWDWDMNHPTQLFMLLSELNSEYKNIGI